MKQKLYNHSFDVDVLPAKHKTWTKQRHNIIYAIAKLLPLLDRKIYFDVGANIGTHAWLCSKFRITAYCFEPNMDLLQYIRKNANPKDIFNCGLSDVNDVGYIESNEQSVGNRVHKKQGVNTKKINLKRLDNLYLPTPGIIKYDVEGHEVPALSGSCRTINKSAPWIVIEHKYNRAGIEAYLHNLGYKIHTDWKKDSIWHRRDNCIPIDRIEVPDMNRDLRKLEVKDW